MKKFLSPDGREYFLAQIPLTGFWTDFDGDLYQVDNAQCYPISGYAALDAVLSRGIAQKAYCPLCGRGELKSSHISKKTFDRFDRSK